MTPRILFLDHAGVMGGAEWSLLDLARALTPRGTVLLFEDGPFREHLEAAGVDVEVCPAPAAMLGVRRGAGRWATLQSVPAVLGYVRRLVRLARAYDVLYANSQKSFVVGALVAGWLRKPLVWHLRNVLSEDGFSASNRSLVIGLANRFATRVIANSETTAEAFEAQGGRPEGVRVVHNGFDPAPFDAVTEEEARTLRQSLGLEGVPLVGCFSRFAPIKGQDVLLDALDRLPGAHALLVGDALFGDEAAYAEGLHRQVERLGLAKRVHFLGYRTDLPVLLKTCDVVVMPSVAPESFGRVAVEGMLAERPVVATEIGAAVELVEDGVTGRLVPPRDAEALAEAVGALLASPQAARAMAAAGRRAALARFSLARMTEGIERVISEVAPAP